VVHDVGVRVLVVEDHVELARDIAEGLRDRGIATDVAYDGAAALQKGLVYRYDVIVLDRDLPAVHGDAVCVRLRDTESEARILMLTAAAAIGDRVEGLNLGADDYLPKPFAFEELVARIYALARRAAPRPVRHCSSGAIWPSTGHGAGSRGADESCRSRARSWASSRSCWRPTAG
jgi:DNA-binding response OmpR family regulator